MIPDPAPVTHIPVHERALGASTLPTVSGAPRAAAGLIPRRRFVEWMTAHERTPVRMVCGGAGYGKTSALLSWLDERDHDDSTAMWITLDDSLRDRGAFWLLVLHHFRRAGIRVDLELERALLAPGSLTSLLPTLLIRQFEASGPVLMIIDNGDLGAGTDIADDLTRTLDHVASFRIVFTTRSAPGTTRIEQRLGQRVAACSPDLVLLEPAEIGEMASSDGHPLSAADAQQLHDTTHGWPLAVRAELMSFDSEARPVSVAPGTATRALGARLLDRFRPSPGFALLRRRALAATVPSTGLAASLQDLLDEFAEVGLG